MSFVLGIITCFVIISGVMIWLVARQKANMPEKKRRFNRRVVRIYLAICLSMYPITALAFIGAKLFYPLNQSQIYTIYFGRMAFARNLFYHQKKRCFYQ